ncbi:MAG: glycosyltransferase family 2 protein [Armatimonadota bacterium]
MSTTDLTIVVPAYNAAATIRRALDSLRAQTWQDFEIVVVDDGSADNTAHIVTTEYPEVRCIRQDNAGPCVARNRGAHEARGEFLAFLDADDEWAPEKAQRQMEVFAQRPDVAVCGTNGIIIHGRRVYPFNNPHRPRLVEPNLKDLLWGVHPVLASLMLRRELFVAVGGYDPGVKRWEDQDLFYRLAGLGHKVVELNEPLYIIHRTQGSRVTHQAAQRVEWSVRTLLRWDPDGAPPGCASPLDRATYSYLLGDRACLAAADCCREGAHEKAREILGIMDQALERPAAVHRGLRALANAWWPAFTVAGTAWRTWRTIERGYVLWGGLLGALRQVWRRYLRRTDGSPQRWH